MHKRGDQLSFSPHDLCAFVKSPWRSWMDRYDVEFPGVLVRDPDEALPWAPAGLQHEATYFDKLRAQHTDVHSVADGLDMERREAATLAAMRHGHSVILNGALRRGQLAGKPDVLRRVAAPSKLGAWSYVAEEVKLARKVQPAHKLQLAAYGWMLEGAQGVLPKALYVVNRDMKPLPFGTRDLLAEVQLEKHMKAFLRFHASFDAKQEPTPHPRHDVGSYCPWRTLARAHLQRIDHPSLMKKGITLKQIKHLADAGVKTLAALAATGLERVHGISDAALEKLKQRASLVVRSVGLKKPIVERAGADLGLPPTSPLDVYIDFEGVNDILLPTAREYLLGVGRVTKEGVFSFEPFWAHDDTQEKALVERFIDSVVAARRADPSMHVFHYAAYERTALKRLTARYQTRQAELQALLDAGAFVDLLKVVRQAIEHGHTSNSLKEIERQFMPHRGERVRGGLQSIVEYVAWVKGEKGDDALGDICAYNRRDVEALPKLRAWLKSVVKK